MKSYLLSSFAAIVFIFSACTNRKPQNAKTILSPTEFEDKITKTPSALVIDVRTAQEFKKGHLLNAVNIDWDGFEFDNKISVYNKSMPVFIYCLSGSRSSAAAKQMRSAGFKEVYELNGGIMKWRSAHLPETTGNTIAIRGITKQQFDELLNSDKLVLVDFYADWCGPCKQMKPHLDEISLEIKDKVVVIGINTDDNPALCRELGVDAIPVLQLYKNSLLTWTHAGYLNKSEIIRQLQ